MYCAVCGVSLSPIHVTAYLQCCGGLGYWNKLEPVAKDSTWKKYQGWYLHISDKWPIGMKARYPIK